MEVQSENSGRALRYGRGGIFRVHQIVDFPERVHDGRDIRSVGTAVRVLGGIQRGRRARLVGGVRVE